MELLYETESYEIRGAVFEVYKTLGCGHKEVVYQKALEQVLLARGLKVEREKRLPVLFNGKIVGTYTPDFLINEKIFLELKTKTYIAAHDTDQFWHYLTGTNYTLGFLVNFGKPGGAEIIRRVYDIARHKVPRLSATSSASFRDNNGFTLMEIIVATTIFAIVFASLLSLFNYALRINRRSEALRQASQGMRDFAETLVKEIRNGKVDYYVANGDVYVPPISPTSPCKAPYDTSHPVTGDSTYALESNWLGIINSDGVQECYYYGNSGGNYIDTVGSPPLTFATSTGGTLVMQKAGLSGTQILNPPNFKINSLMFLVRPTKDPYTPTGGLAKFSPVVSIFINFTTTLPTGEQVPIYYQTSVTSNQYDIPNH